MLNKILFGLAALLCAAGTAEASGNNINFAVSITIPAIPGVNVPLEEATDQQENSSAIPKTEISPEHEESKTENYRRPAKAAAQKHKETVIV